MLIDDIKNQKNKVFIFGINNVSISLINFLTSNEINVELGYIDENIVNKNKEYFLNNQYLNMVELDKINFDIIDYFVICGDILFEKEELKIFLKRLDNIIDKVFIDIEFISILFPQNKYVGIIGSDYNFIMSNMLNKICTNNNTKFVDFSMNNEVVVKNDINFENKLCFGVIQGHKITYLKKINFYILAFLDSDFDYINKCSNKDCLKYIKSFLLKNKNYTLILNIDDNNIKNIYNDTDINFDCKMIPISVEKILNNGISYVNGTMYNYLDNSNESYDVIINDYFLGNIIKISLLTSFIIAYEINIDIKDFVESIKNFNGTKDRLENINEVGNIKFISNIGADTYKLFYSPFDIYDNIYAIFIVNDKQNDLSYLNHCLNKTKNVFFVDICGLLDVSKINSEKNILKFDSLDIAFNYVIEKIQNEDKEKNTTVLLSAIISDEMNYVYYCNYAKIYKNLIKGIK